MKRIWMVTMKAFDYLPLRAGLGLITEEELASQTQTCAGLSRYTVLCPKIYTTRTRPMQGEYCVVEGNRFKAKLVEPRIEFQVRISEELDLRRGIFKKGDSIVGWAIANRNDLTFPELDLGIKGSSFSDLKGALLKLNPKSTVDSPFYVNRLESLERR